MQLHWHVQYSIPNVIYATAVIITYQEVLYYSEGINRITINFMSIYRTINFSIIKINYSHASLNNVDTFREMCR